MCQSEEYILNILAIFNLKLSVNILRLLFVMWEIMSSIRVYIEILCRILRIGVTKNAQKTDSY